MAGDHDDRRGMRHGLDAGECFEAIHAGEPDVEKDDIEATVGRAFEGAFGGFRGFCDVAFVGENGREGFADAGFVVNDQDVWFGWHQSGFGSPTYKVQSTR